MLVNDFEVDMVGKNRSVNWKKKKTKIWHQNRNCFQNSTWMS